MVRLPDIERQISEAILDVHEQLLQLPKPPSSDPFSEVLTLLHDFTRDVSACVEGIPRSNGFLQHIRPQQEKFRAAVRDTAPDFRPWTRAKNSGTQPLQPDFLLAEDGPVHLQKGAAVFLEEVMELAQG